MHWRTLCGPWQLSSRVAASCWQEPGGPFQRPGHASRQPLAAVRRRRRARSARRTSPAKRARAAWRPRAPARTPRATWARAGRSRPRSGSRPARRFTLAEIDGPGAIQQIWMTPDRRLTRPVILRIYWDGQEQPSVECPVGDFFACGWGKYCAGQLAGGLRQPRQRLQLLLGDAVPQAGAGSRWRTSTPRT